MKRKKMLKKLFTIVALFMLICGAVSGEVFIAGTAQWQPYAYYDGAGNLTGISVEIVRELSKRSGHAIHMELYPAKRLNLMFDKNRLDMNFADSALWNEVSPAPDFVFSIPYMQVSEFLYFNKTTYVDTKKLNDLQGKTIGIVSGYYYPMLEPEFESNRIKKLEFPNETALLMGLKALRADAAIFDDILFEVLLKQKQYPPGQFKRGLQLSNAPLGIKFRIEKKAYVIQFNSILESMLKDQTIPTIIQKYTQ